MSSHSSVSFTERRRLGGWLPRKEPELAAFRKDLAAKARRAGWAGSARKRSRGAGNADWQRSGASDGPDTRHQ